MSGLEGLAMSLLENAATTLIFQLNDLKSLKKHNVAIAAEVDNLKNTVEKQVRELQRKLPSNASPWAVESLEADLNKASSQLQDYLNKGKFRAFWDANEIKDELEKIRRELVNAFQLKLQITSLELAVRGNERMDDFQSTMFQLFTKHSAATRTEMRKLLQPVVVGRQKQDQALQNFINMAQDPDNEMESSESQKFLIDILGNLEDLIPDAPPRQPQGDELDHFYDPITFDVMYDPVKCSDGRTYNRWTIIDNNLTTSPFDQRRDRTFGIEVDDVDVRRRVFEHFHGEGLEEKFHRRRNSYRVEALTLAKEEHYAEALGMLEQVLKWDYKDTECLKMRDEMAAKLNKSTSSTLRVPAHLDSTVAASAEPMKAPAPASAMRPPPVVRLPSSLQSLPALSTDDGCPLGCRLCTLVCCFPCSLCCITCLLPEYTKRKA